MKTVVSELVKYEKLISELQNKYPIFKYDQYSIVINSFDGSSDLMFTALMHGDEVVGLEAFNLFLENLVHSNETITLKIALVLANVEAAKNGKRFIESDLNRSYLIEKIETIEHRRSLELIPIVEKTKFIVDFHQTVQPTKSAFYIFGHEPKLIKMANFLDDKLPLVTFPPLAFSHSGKTMLEYAWTKHIPGIAIEWGQMGFDNVQAINASRFMSTAIEKLSNVEITMINGPVNREIFQFVDFVPNKNKFKLVSGLENLMNVSKGQILATNDEENIHSKYDGYIFFPKYGALADASPELCEIAIRSQVEII